MGPAQTIRNILFPASAHRHLLGHAVIADLGPIAENSLTSPIPCVLPYGTVKVLGGSTPSRPDGVRTRTPRLPVSEPVRKLHLASADYFTDVAVGPTLISSKNTAKRRGCLRRYTPIRISNVSPFWATPPRSPGTYPQSPSH